MLRESAAAERGGALSRSARRDDGFLYGLRGSVWKRGTRTRNSGDFSGATGTDDQERRTSGCAMDVASRLGSRSYPGQQQHERNHQHASRFGCLLVDRHLAASLEVSRGAVARSWILEVGVVLVPIGRGDAHWLARVSDDSRPQIRPVNFAAGEHARGDRRTTGWRYPRRYFD